MYDREVYVKNWKLIMNHILNPDAGSMDLPNIWYESILNEIEMYREVLLEVRETVQQSTESMHESNMNIIYGKINTLLKR